MKLYTVIRNGSKYGESDTLQGCCVLSDRIRTEDAEALPVVASRIGVCKTADLMPCEVGSRVVASDPYSDTCLLVEYVAGICRDSHA